MSAVANQNRAEGISGQMANEMSTPNRGATEKNAPVRAVPSVRNPTTNKVRLRP